MEQVTMRPVGVVRTPFAETSAIPKGRGAAHTAEGELVIREDLEPGLLDIEGFSHLYVIWVFDRSDRVTDFEHIEGAF